MHSLGHEVSTSDGLYGRTYLDDLGRTRCSALPEVPADVVVFQRPTNILMGDCIRLVKEQGIHTVVELDDDLGRIHPSNEGFKHLHPRANLQENWHHLETAIQQADSLSVSTPALAERYGGVIPTAVAENRVPRSMTMLPDAFHGGRVRIGWTGTVSTHPNDLPETRGAVQRVLANSYATFTTIGPGKGVAEGLGLVKPVEGTGWVQLPQYPRAVNDNIDIGIVPLADTSFNQAKSWLKGLEFAALGIPFVASPTREYRRLSEEYGVGLIAEKPKDWYRHLKALVTDAAYRRELGGRYRDYVTQFLLVEDSASQWANAWLGGVRAAASA
jgi:glycosyltransferase involved in cell wall biosynthesis